MAWAEIAGARQTNWAGKLAEALAHVAGFLDLRAHTRSNRLETDVRTLVEPVLPLLMHKREKSFASSEISAPEQRWRDEIAYYVDRILWPMLAVDEDSRGRVRTRVIGLVDALVTAQQAHTDDVTADPQPMVWRSGWAG
jgi:hypothetical protein